MVEESITKVERWIERRIDYWFRCWEHRKWRKLTRQINQLRLVNDSFVGWGNGEYEWIKKDKEIGKM